MKYRVTSGEKQYVIDLDDVDGELRITLEGCPIPVDVDNVGERETFNLLLDGRSFTVTVRKRSGNVRGVEYSAAVAGQTFELGVEDERTRSLGKLAGGPHDEGELLIKAPMPGLVLRVLGEPGMAVEKNAHLVVLEAMKMENEISTPRAGIVKEIRVTAGQKVNQGDALAVIV